MGDREVFRGIVEGYQTMVCSLAFSTCGNLATSQNLAKAHFSLGDFQISLPLTRRRAKYLPDGIIWAHSSAVRAGDS